MDFSSSKTTENNQEKVIKNCQSLAETIDPDYVSVLPEKLPKKGCLSEQQQDAKDNTIHKIKNIIRKQFAMEMHLKEQEIETIDQRIRQTKAALDRLRACVLARYYGMSQDFHEDGLVRSSKGTWSTLRRSRRERASCNTSNNPRKSQISKHVNNTGSLSCFAARTLANSHSASSEKTTTNITPTEKKTSSLEDYKNSVSSAALSALTFQSTSHSKLTNGEVQCTSVGAKGSVLSTSSNEIKSRNTMGSISQQQSRSPSDISISYSGGKNTSSLGSNSSGQLIVRGIQLNVGRTQSIASGNQLSASETQSSACGTHLSASGTQSNASGIQFSASGTQLNASGTQFSASGTPAIANQIQSSALTQSKEVGTQLSASQTPLSATLQGSNIQGSHLNVPANLRGTHMSVIKDVTPRGNAGSGSRFYVKKRVIIGNTSKYIPSEKREENDKSTHKWMVYMRGPPEDPHIDAYIQKVWFFLHPSYRPNDIIEVKNPPFHLTRRGWGEFPIRVQLHFVGTRNKRVDIIHELKLDKTYTGLQTLGAETIVDLEIDRKTFEDLGIPVSWELSQDTCDMTSKTTAVASLDISSIRNPGMVKLKRECPSSASGSETGHVSSSAVKKPRLDTPVSSVSSTPCGSRINSRCASPILKNTPEIHDDGQEDQLHSLAERIPLISSKKDVVNHPFSAPSAEEFLTWNVGKRRAAEWQRAAKIRAQLKKCVETSDMTTKDVMVWCRRFGYTPQENLVMNEKVKYCKICGKLVVQDTDDTSDTRLGSCDGETCSNVAQKEMSSLTPMDDILKEIENKEKVLNEMPSKRDNEDDLAIDVVALPNTTKPGASTANSSVGSLTIPLSPQEQWIKDICNDIGIRIRPVTIQNVEVNAVERILLRLAMKFAATLLHKASSLSVNSECSLDANLVIPVHIYKAIGALSSCDFLGNNFFGHASEDQ